MTEPASPCCRRGRCQRITVSGRTRWSALRHPSHCFESHTQRRRSRRPNCGRFDRRRSRASCCQSAKFSSVRWARVLSAARRAPNRASTRDIALHGSHAARPSSSLGASFGKRQDQSAAGAGNPAAHGVNAASVESSAKGALRGAICPARRRTDGAIPSRRAPRGAGASRWRGPLLRDRPRRRRGR